ncbi:MAG: response regulator [Saccharofermentanales bacterium]
MKINYSILIVDDNKVFTETLSLLIKDILGNKISILDISYDGKDAINKVSDTIYDFIFMDINIPKINGIETSKIINNIYYRSTTIIAISFYDNFSNIEKMILSGAKYFLNKDKITIDILEDIFNYK